MWVQQREQIRKEKCKAVLTTSDLEHAYSCSAHQLPSLVTASQISHLKSGCLFNKHCWLFTRRTSGGRWFSFFTSLLGYLFGMQIPGTHVQRFSFSRSRVGPTNLHF